MRRFYTAICMTLFGISGAAVVAMVCEILEWAGLELPTSAFIILPLIGGAFAAVVGGLVCWSDLERIEL